MRFTGIGCYSGHTLSSIRNVAPVAAIPFGCVYGRLVGQLITPRLGDEA
ncbi:Uncharacterised protein [Mycobacterium tuberculosis]|nr:Uncharacterised protein [Mycobacterium tuberculosis]